jgi:hypothetical protein
MRIVRTTDNKHLGRTLLNASGPVLALNTGDTILIDGFNFEVQHITTLDNGNILLSNPNYQLECEA